MQDVTSGSPGQRAGLRTYDLIIGIDDKRIANNDEIIREVSRRGPGTIARLQVVRDGRHADRDGAAGRAPEPAGRRARDDASPGAAVEQLGDAARSERARPRHRDTARACDFRAASSGVVVTRVDPLSAAYDAGIQRDHVVMEINRRPAQSADAYNRLARAAQPGDVLAVYVYMPGTEQRAIRAIRVDAPLT